MNKDITIVLISHKSRELILTFITSLYNKFKIIIIDNSNDRELEKNIKLNYPNITIRLIKNNGYGSAINFANKFITTDYFIISNPDIIGLDEENILKFLSASNELDGQFSCLGPRYIDADKKSHIQSDLKIEIAEMKFISGACMFFKKKHTIH